MNVCWRTQTFWDLSLHLEEKVLFSFIYLLLNFIYLFIYYLILFIYLFLAVLGLCCRVRASSSCSERGLLFVAVRGLLIVVASLVAEHGLYVHGLSSCGTQAL